MGWFEFLFALTISLQQVSLQQRIVHPKMFAVSTRAISIADTSSLVSPSAADSIDVGAEFLVLSLVDSVLYENFERHASALAATYTAKEVLLAVARHDSQQKFSFMTTFYKEILQQKSKRQAFDNAMLEAKRSYDSLDFKAILIEKEK